MPLQYKTLDELVEIARAELRRQKPNIDPTVFGSWARGFIDGCGALAHALGFVVRDLEQQLFPQTAIDEFLDRWGDYEDLPRNSASPASGPISINGTPGTLITAGTAFTAAGNEYESTATAAVEIVTILVTSITRSGSVATATLPTPHKLATGMSVTISGADQAEYNGTFSVTVTGERIFTYTVTGAPVSPATGTISETSNFATVTIQSVDTGPDKNLSAGAIVTISAPIAGLNSQGFVQFGGVSGGTDIETDDEYRSRIIESRSDISGVFTEDQIKIAARAVPGNTRVFVKRPVTALGSGTQGLPSYSPAAGQVVVIVVRDNDENIIPTQTILDQTKQAIIDNGKLPAHSRADDVFVLGPVAQVVDFTFTSISPNTETMKSSIRNQLQAFFEDVATFEQDITEAAYLGTIQNTRDAVTSERLNSFTLSAPTGDIVVSAGNIPVLGAVAFS